MTDRPVPSILLILSILFIVDGLKYVVDQPLDNHVLLNRHKRSVGLEYEVKDEHDYYKSRIINNKDPVSSQYLQFFKTELKDHSHDIYLSNASRSFRSVNLAMPFTYYGHDTTTILVTTGGFIHMKAYTHPYLTHGEYVAPLMADFSPKLQSDSYVYFKNTPNYFIAYWHNVYLAYNDTNSTIDETPFSFHLALFPNGTIVFHYENIPVTPAAINDEGHKVTVGIADSYFYYTDYYRYIVKYHTISLNLSHITNDTVIILNPLPTCHEMKTCAACIQPNATRFQCSWCFSANRCSSGTDRQVQDWENKKCNIQEETKDCIPPTTTATPAGRTPAAQNKGKTEPHTVLLIIFFAALVAFAIGWLIFLVVWAYKHPTSSVGMWFIRNRPSVLFSKCKNCCRNSGESHSRMRDDLTISYNAHGRDPGRDHMGGARFTHFDDPPQNGGGPFGVKRSGQKVDIYAASSGGEGDATTAGDTEMYANIGEPHSTSGTRA